MGVDLSIRNVLMARLAALTLTPPLSVVWENLDAAPVAGGWLEAQLFRSSTDRILVGNAGPHRRLGFLQVAGGWLEAQLFRSSTDRLLVGNAGPHRRLGFLQVAVMMPLSDGAVKADAVAEAVQAHFPCGLTLLPGLRITGTPHIAGGYPDGEPAAWWRVPVTVNFESLAS